MCEALGKSSKDPVLAFREVRLERQLGGSLAIARHCAGLGAQVTLGTALGPEPETARLITQELASHVALQLHVQEARPTIIKRRFVDEGSMQRVFETYQMAAETSVADDALDSYVAKLLKEPFDVVLVCDYGHGFFSSFFSERRRCRPFCQ